MPNENAGIIRPYEGDAPYIFISYAHRDYDRIEPILRRMQDERFRIWYDEAITPGTEWDDNIANHVVGCGYFIAFISRNYLNSQNCCDELNFARDENKERLLVYLEDVTLPPGMRMRLNRLQAIFYHKYDLAELFYEKLFAANNIDRQRSSKEETPHADDASAAPIRPYEPPQEATEPTPHPAGPDEFEISGSVLVKYRGKASCVTIPDGVTGIGESAFSGCAKLMSVTIPDSVTSIGEYAFKRCTGLKNVTLPKSVTSIGERAYSGCTGLKSVTIPDSVTSIGENAFSGCTGLTNIVIPNSVTRICPSAFSDCTGLTNVTISNSATSIGDWAFLGCQDLTITAPAASEAIRYAQENSISYAIIGQKPEDKHITLDNYNPDEFEINGTALIKYKGTAADVMIPDGVTRIGQSAFSECSGLTNVTIPDSVTAIEKRVFFGCTDLESIRVSANNKTYHARNNCLIETAGKKLIAGCKSSVIPTDGSVTSIAPSAFSGCSGLSSVTIPDGATDIGTAAFSGCSSLANVAIPDSVTNISSRAFSSCVSLTDVVIPAGVTSISNRAFSDCTSLTTVTIPDGVTSIGERAFFGCTELTCMFIPDSVTEIKYCAFENCANLKSIVIPNSATSIGSWVFKGCPNLTIKAFEDSQAIRYAKVNRISYDIIRQKHDETPQKPDNDDSDGFVIDGTVLKAYKGNSENVAIPYGVTDIGSEAFKDRTKLTSVTIPDSVTEIGSGAFKNCTGLTGVIIPDNVTSIAEETFYGCTNLTSVTIGTSIMSIGQFAFFECKGLMNVTIPGGVTSIDRYAFFRCEGLTSVTIRDGAVNISPCAFGSCSVLKSIIIPESVISIGERAFAGCMRLTINAHKGSEAIRYAQENEISYAIIGQKTEENYISLENNDPAEFEIDGTALKKYKGNARDVTIPNGVTDIGYEAFKGCTELMGVSIPDSVTTIRERAFFGCRKLASVTIPDGVTSIGTGVLAGCAGLGKILVSTGNRNYSALNNCLIETAEKKLIAGCKNSRIPTDGSIISIDSWAFFGCKELTNVMIPDSVTDIGVSTFSFCTGLESIRVSKDNKVYHAVNNCLIETAEKKLIAGCKNSVIPKDGSVTKIGPDAFFGCTKLMNVTIPDGMIEIGNYAFLNCSGLTGVTIPGTVTRIGLGAFEHCSELSRVTIPRIIINIGNRAFFDCPRLTIAAPAYSQAIQYARTRGISYEVIDPDSAEVRLTLENCDPRKFEIEGKTLKKYKGNLRNVTIPYGLTDIGDWAFSGRADLTNVIIPDSVTRIGYWAFENCSKLMSVTIPKSVTTFGRYAFSGCPKLTIKSPEGSKAIRYAQKNGIAYELI